jgi:hypothetical protein
MISSMKRPLERRLHQEKRDFLKGSQSEMPPKGMDCQVMAEPPAEIRLYGYFAAGDDGLVRRLFFLSNSDASPGPPAACIRTGKAAPHA